MFATLFIKALPVFYKFSEEASPRVARFKLSFTKYRCHLTYDSD